MNFSDLSTECVRIILDEYLKTYQNPWVLVRVCKQWKFICKSLCPPLEKFDFSKVKYTGRKFYYLCKFKYKYFRGIHDTELFLNFPTTMAFKPLCTCSMTERNKCNFVDCVHDMGIVMTYLSSYCPNVKIIKINVWDLYDNTLIEIANSFSKLQSLDVKYSYYLGTEKNMNETIKFIFENQSSKIRCIKLNYNSFTNSKIQKI